MSGIGNASFQFNAKSLMKERVSWWLLENPTVKREDEIISWFEKDGIYLPVEIVVEKNEPEYSEFTTASIYWRSINEPLDRGLFEPKFLDEPGKLLKCIDLTIFKDGGCINK
jgi:hypothetical protein